MPRTFTRQCPHCTRQATWPDTPTYPFCSERCQLIDLGAWATGEYRLPCESTGDATDLAAIEMPEDTGEDEY